MLIPNFVATKESDITIARDYLAQNSIDLIDCEFADYLPQTRCSNMWLSQKLVNLLSYRNDEEVYSLRDLDKNIQKLTVFLFDLTKTKDDDSFNRYILGLPNGAISEIKDRKFGFVVLANEDILNSSIKHNIGQFKALYRGYVEQLK